MAPQIDPETLDDMHHALGRPKTPNAIPYRNHFVTDAGGDQARRFEASGLWRLTRLINQGRDAVYRVTDEGVAAVRADIAAKRKAEGIRDYRITYRWFDKDLEDVIAAKSPAAARYALYLNFDDAFSGSFARFLRIILSVRLA
jgi:hypothetical protein